MIANLLSWNFADVMSSRLVVVFALLVRLSSRMQIVLVSIIGLVRPGMVGLANV